MTALLMASLILPTTQVTAAKDQDAALLDELRSITQKSREQQAADRWLQRALDDLIAKYDWPWQRKLMYEDFSDGDYTHNPTWQVAQGDFHVIQGKGLASSIRADKSQRNNEPEPAPSQPKSSEDALGAFVLGALLDKALGTEKSEKKNPSTAARIESYTGPNQIRLQANVTNAFAVTLVIRTGLDKPSQFDIALLQSKKGLYGYRLRIATNSKGFVELVRIRNGREAIVDSQKLPININDNRLHDLAWRQNSDGTVIVLLDEKPVIEVRDRAFRDNYPWLQIEHQAGELTIRSVRVDGV